MVSVVGGGCRGLEGRVFAAHSGTVASRPYSRCQMRIIHESDWQTNYYHMDNLLVKPGQYIKQGQAIGKYANTHETAICDGGSSTGPHVHFSLVSPNGKYVSLDGWKISGYTIKAGDRNYDTDCTRCYFEKNGRKYCPWKSWIPFLGLPSFRAMINLMQNKNLINNKYSIYFRQYTFVV